MPLARTCTPRAGKTRNEGPAFLALDFDNGTWRLDVRAVRDACTDLDLPVYILLAVLVARKGTLAQYARAFKTPTD